MSKRYALTLAETMVVLTVLGVLITTLTPIITYNSKKNEYRAGYQRAINTLNNAYAEYLRGGMDNGSSDTGELTAKVDDPAYIGTTNSDGVSMTSSSDIVNKILKKHVNSLDITNDTTPFPGCNLSTGSLFYSGDGMRFCVMYSSCAANANYSDNTCGEIWVDINGAKGPNRISVDLVRLGDIYPVIIMKDRFVPGSTSNETASTNAQNLFFGVED